MCCNDRKVSDHSYFKNYEMIQDTKKFNSSSQIKIKEVLKFPDFKAAGIAQPIDARLKEEIFTSSEFITSVDEMRRRLEIIVTREMFKNVICPSKSNKRFFPLKKLFGVTC
ncbi:uncharacterized protein LOC136087620 isoform X1 [Hydra vulgaris]|uniref:Uncharacterized protein LOC136087620 isoform X1 n=1 Tax=Hydra vulgaris TaxID=6087 RepID=A0ABM4CYI0_HYDVU